MSGTSPTSRTLQRLRKMGFAAEVVERWIPRFNRRRDLFHVIDIVAVHRGVKGVLGIQTTTASNLASRLKKVQAQAEIRVWLDAGNRLELWGWEKRGDQWDVKRLEVKADDLRGVPVDPPRRARRGKKGERQTSLFGDTGSLAPG